jgi:hypothetical protein
LLEKFLQLFYCQGHLRSRRLQKRKISEQKEESVMSKFNDFLTDKMKDPIFKTEYEALEPEFIIIQTMIDARKNSGLTQKQLSEKTGIAQADIT